MSIRARLTAWYALLLALILLGLSVFLVRQLGADVRDSVDRTLRQDAMHLASGYRAEGAAELRGEAASDLPPDAVMQLLDGDGRVVAGYGLAPPRPLASARLRADALAGRTRPVTIEGESEQLRALILPVRRRGRTRVLVVAHSLEEAEEPVERVQGLLLLAGPAALLATALGGWLLAGRALAPVARITAQAEAIGIDRLQDRVEVPRHGDELAHLATTLNAMLDRLERGVEEKRRLVSDASHELRTPLAVMRAELDVSLRADELSPASRDVLASTREEVDRMSRTVDNLLTLAQVDEGRLELLETSLDLDAVIDAALRPLRPLAAAKGVRLAREGEAGAVHGDAQRLHQVITNFADNAIKFTGRGGEVRVLSWRTAEEVGVTVGDDGPGLPAAAGERVFDRFFRVDGARGRGGSGLGLAICREVAAAHGGRVWVDSRPGRGSAFSFALPLDRAARPSPSVSAPA